MAGTKRFKDMPEVSPQTLEVLASLGFESATPVQEATIPLFAGNKDVAVDAQTGSGKTLAFVIPVVEKLRRLDEPLKKHQVGAIIVSPTRELARQIFGVALPFVRSVPGLQAMLLVGGTDPLADVAAFAEAGAHVLVGTPGRLADLVQRAAPRLDLRRLEVLVLDEADRLLDMGFRTHLDAVMQRLPKQRRTGLFSATQTEAVEALARAGLRNPEHKRDKVIVYCLTCACVDLYAAALPRLPAAAGLRLAALHGRMKQAAREAVLAMFAAQEGGALLCTDVAARGLDVPDVGWVVQLDAPQDPDAFVHRVGRTARMGRAGAALALLLPAEGTYVEFLRLRKVPMEEEVLAEGAPETAADLRALGEADRDIMEKATRAFVSYVRGYKEHQCRYIFRAKDLDLGRLANALGLLRLPRMPELRGAVGTASFVPSAVDPTSVKFRDRAREKLRQRRLAQRVAEAAAAAPQANLDRKPGQAGAAERRTSGVSTSAPTQKQERRLPAAKRRQAEARQDEDDFAAEYTLLRKLKRGRLSEHEFDVAVGLIETEEAADARGKVARKDMNWRKGRGVFK
ncbi:hypothetical protein WJX81_006505 [Elliptochloris bilobata]|uniref:ATP-dependent RNA helicase n=1 Tax=Elliptochloris bilobata TaxID=381761 RepID=A0AAW1S8X6_9CHLO